ncbi:MAG: hypothetical protein Q9M26_04170 [Mariprofundales bacterium]|nr:hypothetical protein [Mariprofundales bacterium]
MAFPDLRLQRAGVQEEGFWPSFTDIMTVIVMIFLIAMLGLLLRNMDLVTKLKHALLDAQQASQKITVTSSANRDLMAQLAQREHDLEMLRSQLMDVSRQRQKLEQGQAKLLQQRDALQEALQRQKHEEAALQQQLLAKLSEQQATAALSNKNQQQQLAALQHQLAQQSDQVMALQASIAHQTESMRQLKDSYGELDAKYLRLIRPARSSLGKVVVTVRYLRRKGALTMAIKPPNSTVYQTVFGVELNQKLAKLKEKFGSKLYVRILFPEDSGLSYSEAWRITESLLRLYDYYYQ